MVRLRAVRHQARPDDDRQRAFFLLRRDRRRGRDRPGDGALHAGHADVLARDHLRRSPRRSGHCAQEHRDHAPRADRRARGRAAGRLPGHAVPATRAADRGRHPRYRILLRGGAGQRQGDAGVVRSGRVRDALARLPLSASVREGTDLPLGRPRRPGRADLAAAGRAPGAVRRDRRHPRRGAGRSVDANPPVTVTGEREASHAVAAQPADIRLVEVTKQFDDVVAVDRLTLEVERGSFFALLGPSGCGKTTTLRMIGGFEQPTEGAIYLGDREVSGLPAYKRDVNTVFQSYALFPHLSVLENVAFGLRRRAVRGETLRGRVSEMLRIVGLEGMEKRKPRQLSGGQQQRVALARALVNKPQVLLLDEPLGALDLKLRKQMQLELKGIQHDVGVTFIHVTHDQEEAMTMADRIAVMKGGRIEQLGTPTELYETPSTAFVAGFLGVSNLIPGTVSGPDR